MKKTVFLFLTIHCLIYLSANNTSDTFKFNNQYLSIKNDIYLNLNSIPNFICTYVREKTGEKFKLYKKKKNIIDGLFRGGNIEILKGARYILVKYEHGGIGTHSHLLIFEYSAKNVINFWNLRVLFDNNSKEIIEKKEFELIGLKDL